MIKLLFLITIFIVGNLSNLFAIDATMEIIKQSGHKPKILIMNSLENRESDLSKKILKSIEADLQVSGHFEVIQNNSIKTKYAEPLNRIIFTNNNLDLYLKFRVIEQSSNQLSIFIKFFDLNNQKIIFTKEYITSNAKRFPFLAHKIVIDVNNYLKAPPIDWMEKFIIFARYVTPRESEIVIADYTLKYQKVIVKGGLNIFPKWANKSQNSFYYTTYLNKPTLMKVDIYTGQRKEILSSEGMLVCSDVSDDGSKLLLTMSPNYQPDIYLFDTFTRSRKQITFYKGIDVSGHFIENSQKIAFVSDRLGYPNIFTKSFNSSAAERLVYHGKNNNSCSTFEDYVVYTSRDTNNEFARNSFNLYLISTKSDFIRKLSSIGVNQFPNFSVDGESILFIKQYKEESSLGIIRVHYNKSFLFPLKRGKIQSIDW